MAARLFTRHLRQQERHLDRMQHRIQDSTHSTNDNATTPTAITTPGWASRTQPTPDTRATSDHKTNARLLILSILLSHILYATWQDTSAFSTRASSTKASRPRTGQPSRASSHVLKSTAQRGSGSHQCASQHARP